MQAQKQRPVIGHVRRGDMVTKNLLKAAVKIGKPIVKGVGEFFGEAFDALGNKIGALPAENQAFKETFNPQTYYHGTYSDIESFDPNLVDIGVHVGTTEQANERLRDLSLKRPDFQTEGAQVLPLKVNTQNPLRMHDVGMWNDSEQLFNHLYEVASGIDQFGKPSKYGYKPNKKLLKAIEDRIDVDELEDIFDSIDGGRYEWQASPENREFLDQLREAVKDAGYDSIQYKNIVESTSSGMGELLPEAKAQIDQINAELRAISKAAADRKNVSLPDVGDPDAEAKIQEWLAIDSESLKTPEEIAREYELDALRDQLDTQRLSADSLIVLDPENIRSVNAKFDPKMAGSASLLAGVGGLGMLNTFRQEGEQ
jgi:hypothetical protein